MDTALVSSMEQLDIDTDSDLPFSSSPEFGFASMLLDRYQNSPDDDHRHHLAAVGVISQTLKDQQIPLTPIAYFGATFSSPRDPNSGSDPHTSALLSLLSVVAPRVSSAVSRSWDQVAEMVVRVLGLRSLPVSGIRAGLKCVGILVRVGEKGNWDKVSAVYGVVLGFVTDPRPMVIKQSHACLYDVLQSFQGSPSIVLVITNLFERYLLLAGRSNSSTLDAADGPRGAWEALYILHAFKDCLPLMLKKYTIIKKHCKTLVKDLTQPIVIRAIMEIL